MRCKLGLIHTDSGRIRQNCRNRPIWYRPKFKLKKKGAKRTISTQTKPLKPKTLSHLWIICSAPLYLSALSCLRLLSLLWAFRLPSLSQTYHSPLSQLSTESTQASSLQNLGLSFYSSFEMSTRFQLATPKLIDPSHPTLNSGIKASS